MGEGRLCMPANARALVPHDPDSQNIHGFMVAAEL